MCIYVTITVTSSLRLILTVLLYNVVGSKRDEVSIICFAPHIIRGFGGFSIYSILDSTHRHRLFQREKTTVREVSVVLRESRTHQRLFRSHRSSLHQISVHLCHIGSVQDRQPHHSHGVSSTPTELLPRYG